MSAPGVSRRVSKPVAWSLLAARSRRVFCCPSRLRFMADLLDGQGPPGGQRARKAACSAVEINRGRVALPGNRWTDVVGSGGTRRRKHLARVEAVSHKVHRRQEQADDAPPAAYEHGRVVTERQL